MSAVSLNPSQSGPNDMEAARGRRWIMSSWLDHFLIISTPLMVIPIVFACYIPLQVSAKTISIFVGSFFALGHHLPGMIRAYGDRELFQRFRWRFLLAPPLVFLAYFPLDRYHADAYHLIIVTWAMWHGLMQLYGFVRIYDAKVGSVSRTTAYWDWLVCLCWFVTAPAFSPARMSDFLANWYSIGGPVINPLTFQSSRWVLLGISITVLIGFFVNYLTKWLHGPKPNPVKLLMLCSGIGTWWFSVVFVENVILGVALNDVCHDVQYLAIVWLYNSRRVNSNARISSFMKFVFCRGMLLLYLGLIAAYGAIGLIPELMNDGTVVYIIDAFLWTSTILHYYYDGFIWKVREKETSASLGLNSTSSVVGAPRVRSFITGDYAHLLKWAPLVLVLSGLFVKDLVNPSLTQHRRDELDQSYSQLLGGAANRLASEQERLWLSAQTDRTRLIADSVPGDRSIQLKAATLLANLGHHDEALALLEKMVQNFPGSKEGYETMGALHLLSGQFDRAAASFKNVLYLASSEQERATANLKLGIIGLYQNDPASADARFNDAIRENPGLEPEITGLRRSFSTPDVRQ
jgi:tetratricopeptide (TPR) repeat protein